MKGRGGFTLLEVMIALAILATVALTVISSFNYHLSIVARDGEEVDAVLMGRSKLEELTATGDALEAKEGSFPTRPGMTWKVEIEPTQVPTLKKATLTVFWDQKRKKLALDRYL